VTIQILVLRATLPILLKETILLPMLVGEASSIPPSDALNIIRAQILKISYGEMMPMNG
jgi:hypothetical protein